jgi:uncharacterized protein DUF1206
VLAAKLALGDGGMATSREGALATLADEPLGKALLVALAIGFAGYALWRFAQAVFDRENKGSGVKGLAKRAADAGRGVVYTVLAVAAGRLVAGAGEQEAQNEKAQRATAEVLSWPAGTWLVGIAGVFVVGVGLYNGYRGLTRSFEDELNAHEMSRAARCWCLRLGTAGLLARMVVFVLIGVFLLKAALEFDPREAVGLDGALQELTRQAYGSWLLGLVAIGLIAFAVFGLIEARYRRV